jgi:hypothetical protein
MQKVFLFSSKLCLICINVTELFDQLGSLPTIDYIKNLLQMKPAHFEEFKNAEDKTILLWYVDRWLPVVIGLEYWDDKIRHFNLMTDKTKLRTGDEVVLCTTSSEAFGLMMYENCHAKWEEIMKLKKENKGKSEIFCVILLQIWVFNNFLL